MCPWWPPGGHGVVAVYCVALLTERAAAQRGGGGALGGHGEGEVHVRGTGAGRGGTGTALTGNCGWMHHWGLRGARVGQRAGRLTGGGDRDVAMRGWESMRWNTGKSGASAMQNWARRIAAAFPPADDCSGRRESCRGRQPRVVREGADLLLLLARSWAGGGGFGRVQGEGCGGDVDRGSDAAPCSANWGGLCRGAPCEGGGLSRAGTVSRPV